LGGLLENKSEDGITNPFISTDKLADKSKMRYIMDLISGYLIEYYKDYGETSSVQPAVGNGDGAPSTNSDTNTIYDPNSEDLPSFREQLLQYQLEILRDNLILEIPGTSNEESDDKTPAKEYQGTTYTTTPQFDLKTPTGNSIRKQRPDLERLFKSIDEIIGLPST